MTKRVLSALLFIALAALAAGCAGEKMELQVKATLDGGPAAAASVTVDGVAEGVTGSDGTFAKQLKKKPGAEVEVVVAKEQPGYRITPWKTTFLMKLPKKGAVDTYSFAADLQASKYVTLVALEAGAPVAEAVVRSEGKDIGTTDAKGEFVYEYRDLPKEGVDLAVTKSGYSVWKRTGEVKPGERIEAVIAKRSVVTVTALMDEYGQASGIPGIAVLVDKKQVAKTDAKGTATWSWDGEPGRKATITLSAPGYVPQTWKTSVALSGEIVIQRYFTPTVPRPIRTGIYRFVGNTPNVDLKEVLAQTEEAMASQLFRFSCFRKVPFETLQKSMKSARVNVERLAPRGWRETSLRRTADMIVLGSVAKDEHGYLIETKFVASSGKIVHSQLARAAREKDIPSAAKDIAVAVLARFPFEGTVLGAVDDRYKINLGKEGYRISRNMEFTVSAPRTDEAGRVTGYSEIGKLKIKRADDAFSLGEIEDLKKGQKVSPGDRVVRQVAREDEEKSVAVIMAKGGVPPDVAPLAGVNIYLNENWVSTTGADGTAEVPVRIGKKYDLVLYRHGYQQVMERMSIAKDREAKAYTLAVNNAIFTIDSQPSPADVFVDGDKVGRTPITDGRPVTLGFHTVRVAAGGDYRDWEEVVEFASKTEARTGSKAIVLHKDYLKIGERASQKGDVDGAIAAYQAADKGHPDYSEAHHRLAQLYLDEKNDHEGAIREFENVMTLPENQQLVHKQYAVAFTNLGHAYYERGSEQVPKDKEAAAQSFAKAIQNLQTAKQNTRFFPTAHYDEAVHDTYYYLALSYHKLYLLTKKPGVLNSANLAWQEYFDFFPKKLEGNANFDQNRQAAQTYWDQIKGQM